MCGVCVMEGCRNWFWRRLIVKLVDENWETTELFLYQCSRSYGPEKQDGPSIHCRSIEGSTKRGEARKEEDKGAW